MIKSIRRLFATLLLAAALPLTAYAQKPAAKPAAKPKQTQQQAAFGAPKQGDMAAGGNLALSTGDGFTNFGIGAKFQFNVIDPLRLEGSFAYFFESNLVSMWDLSVNTHWLFPVADRVAVYPLAGLSLLGVTVNLPTFFGFGGGSYSDNEVGVNLGGGTDYQLTDKLALNAELKFKIVSNWSRLFISTGIAYRF